MSSTEKVSVLLDGSKTFWKIRSNMKVVIVNHPKQNCLETIVYDPVDGVEFRRIYLDTLLMGSKFDNGAIEKAYTVKKEALVKQKVVKNRDEIILEIKSQMMLQYAYSRVNLVPLPGRLGKMQFCLQPSFDDILVEAADGTKKIDVERAKPEKLIPFEVTKNIPKAQVDEVKPAGFIDINKNKKIVNAEIKKTTRTFDLLSDGLQGFFAAFRRNHVFNPAWSQSRRRWVKAIRKVIMRNFHSAIKVRLIQSALVLKPLPSSQHMVVTGLVVVAKNRFLGLRRKRSFCDERLGLSSNNTNNVGAFGYTKSKNNFGAVSGSFGRSSSKNNLASLSQDKSDPIASSLRNTGRAAVSNSTGDLRIDAVTPSSSSKLAPLLPSIAGAKGIGGRKGSFDDSQLKETSAIGVAARAALDAADFGSSNDEEDEIDEEEVRKREKLQMQREKENNKEVYEMLDHSDITSILSIFAPEKGPTSSSNALPPIRSALSINVGMDSPKVGRPRPILIPRSGMTSPTNASESVDSPSSVRGRSPGGRRMSRDSAGALLSPTNSFRSSSPGGGRRMSRDRGTPGIDLSAEAFDKLVLGINTSSDLTENTSAKNSPSLARGTAAQDARNGAFSPPQSLSRQNSNKLASPSSKNNSAKTTPRGTGTPRTPRGGFSRENRAELEGTQYSTASVSNDEYLHDIMSSPTDEIKVQSIGIAAGGLPHLSIASPEVRLKKQLSSVSSPRTPVIPANTVLITGAHKVISPVSSTKRRASHLSVMKTLRSQQGSDSEDATYCSDQELNSDDKK